MGHYYTNESNLISNERVLKYTFRNNTLILKSDTGVFCKDHIDFGTNVLLNSIPVFENNSRILDVGCGYGLIGLSIAKSNGTYSVDMIDVNKKAIGLSLENKKNNLITNALIFESDVYENVNEAEYDYIITNPPIRAGKSVVHDIVLNGYSHLKSCGKIYVVIQKKQGAPSLISRMEEVYSEVNIINKEKGYYIIEGIK